MYRLRGQAFDTIGDFDKARADYEAAQKVAQSTGDQRLIWQTVLDLAQLWASRDYEKYGKYCKQALDLARSMEDPAAIGHSLNRVGNWLMNTGQPLAALDCHREALGHFETLDDQPGIAATLDLLAATDFFCGNLAGAVAHYERATHILRNLNHHQTLVSTLANLALSTLNENRAREALTVAEEIEWRSGEAYALHNLGLVLSTRGDYGQGLNTLQRGLELAQAIDHRLWQSAFNIDLGFVYMALLTMDKAQSHLESGLEIAKEIGANIMVTYASGRLGALYIAQKQFDKAALHLPDLPVQPIMGQDYWLVRPAIELVAIRKGATSALQLLDRQELSDPSNWLGWPAYFYGTILQFRGQLLMELGQHDEAEAVLQSALNLYKAQGIRMDLGLMYLTLWQVYQAQGKYDEAKAAFTNAEILIEELASTVADDTLRKDFRRRAFDIVSRSF